MDQLTPEERKQLRLARFGGLNGKSKQHMPAMNEAATTLEALQFLEEQKRKKLERAQRFGIPTKELQE